MSGYQQRVENGLLYIVRSSDMTGTSQKAGWRCEEFGYGWLQAKNGSLYVWSNSDIMATS